jgi:hypothetical protein
MFILALRLKNLFLLPLPKPQDATLRHCQQAQVTGKP